LGLDPKSEDFEASFRDKAISLLQQSGYTVDPYTFALNDVNVSSDGYVSASVTSRFTKTFNPDMASPEMDTLEPTAVAENPENLGPVGQAPESEEADENIETEAAKQLRASKRSQILERIAQLAGMPPAPAAGLGGAAGAGGAAAGAPLGGLGVGNLTGANPMADELGDEPADTDSMSEPGKKMPVGSICPACGSKNVDLADGKGHCNDCETDMEIKYQITINPSSDTKNDENAGAEPEAEAAAPELGGDMGLGAATAPAPEMGGATPGLGGAPAAPGATPAAGMTPMAKSAPIMVRLSWKQDPEVFIKAAQADFDPSEQQILPVGHVCPSCGNRQAKKVQNNRFCYNCGDVYIPRIHKSSDKTKVEVSIDKIV
jgi:ssDNA-binding Zn-finger/Zn-ribbon topoisomerase 1